MTESSVVMTLIFAAAAAAAGHALAQNWRPSWHLAPYMLLLAGGERFFLFALFDADLLSAGGYLAAAAVLAVAGAAAYRLRLARRMVTQYPWLYEPAGLFSWRERKHERG